MSEALTGSVTYPLAQFCVVNSSSFICEKPGMDDVSLTMSLMSIDRPASSQKIPTMQPAMMPEICAKSHQSPEATNKMSVYYPGEVTNEL